MITSMSLIMVVMLLLMRNVIISAEDCDSGRGECIRLSLCEPARLAIDFTRFKICAEPAGTICCPKRKKPQAELYHEDLYRPAVRACKAYKEQVYVRECGIQPLIYNGTKAGPREFPHMAYLGMKTNNGFEGHCGGTLISPRFVLSAAHCFIQEITHVRLGELDWSTDTDDAQPVDIAINRTIYPPTYNASLKYFDIVLLELEKPAELNEYVVPACMTLSSGDEYNNFTATGWGATKTKSKSEHLLKVYLERFDFDECNIRFDTDFGFMDGVLNRTQICAGSHNSAYDTCQGDSGGPLLVQHPKYPCMNELIGVTSFGTICGKNLPAIYTRVGIYKDWIEQIVFNVPKHV